MSGFILRVSFELNLNVTSTLHHILYTAYGHNLLSFCLGVNYIDFFYSINWKAGYNTWRVKTKQGEPCSLC